MGTMTEISGAIRLELRQRDEALVAALDVVSGERAQAPPAEVLDDERRDDAAVDDAAPEARLRQVAGGREIPEEAAREAVPCPGRVEDLLERVRGDGEDRLGG